MTPLHLAAKSGHIDTVNHLLEQADINIQDENGVNISQYQCWWISSFQLSGGSCFLCFPLKNYKFISPQVPRWQPFLVAWVWGGWAPLKSLIRNSINLHSTWYSITPPIYVEVNVQSLHVLKFVAFSLSVDSPACYSSQWSWLHSRLPCHERSWCQHQKQEWGKHALPH